MSVMKNFLKKPEEEGGVHIIDTEVQSEKLEREAK